MFGQQDFCSLSNAFQNIQNSITTISNRISTISASLIAKINLPIYLQNYTFSSSGSVLTPYFTIVGGLPTNASLRRTWNLVTAGTLSNVSTATSQIIFTYDFSAVNSVYSVTIDNYIPSGTLVINGQVYDAAQYFKTPTYTDNNVLTLTLNLTDISVSTGDNFYYNLYLADDAVCYPNCFQKLSEKGYFPLEASEICSGECS